LVGPTFKGRVSIGQRAFPEWPEVLTKKGALRQKNGGGKRDPTIGDCGKLEKEDQSKKNTCRVKNSSPMGKKGGGSRQVSRTGRIEIKLDGTDGLSRESEATSARQN